MKVGGWREGEVRDAISDEESDVGLESRTGGREVRRKSEFSSKGKLEDAIVGASWRSGPKARLEGRWPAQVGGQPEGAAGRCNGR